MQEEQGAGSGRAATCSARAGDVEVAEAAQAPPLRDRQEPSWGKHHLATDESVEGEVVEQVPDVPAPRVQPKKQSRSKRKSK